MDLSHIARLSLAMTEYFRGDQKRVHHALKVHNLASQMGRLEKLTPPKQMVLETAALLHDIGIHEAERKYGSSSGPYQEKEGPPVADVLLEDYPLSREEKERVLFLIGHHHTYKAVDGEDFQILVEADFLVNMYEDQMTGAQIESLSRNIFRTVTGRTLLSSLSSSLTM